VHATSVSQRCAPATMHNTMLSSAGPGQKEHAHFNAHSDSPEAPVVRVSLQLPRTHVPYPSTLEALSMLTPGCQNIRGLRPS
jgi:hypothetical protein